MPSSAREFEEAKLIAKIIKKLPDELNGRIIAILLVNILYRYGMISEWEKIVEAVDGSLPDIEDAPVINVGKVLTH